MKYIPRDIEPEFLAYSASFPVVLLTGMRQCGKSTMLAHLAKGAREIVTLDNLQDRALAQTDPEMFLQLHQPPLIIDEVQYAPQLFPYLKIYADTHPNDMGAVWLSGSQPFPMMKLAGESLAGRAGILHMLPLSQHELFGTGPLLPFEPTITAMRKRAEEQQPATASPLYHRIYQGGMPAVANGRTTPERFYGSYVQTYIERDVRELDRSADILDFSQFMAATAAHIGQLLNVDSLARDVGISREKAREWLGILEKSDIVFLLQPYSNNALSRAIKTPKLYFTDPGLAVWLGRWSSPETLEAGALSGQAFENYVVSELRHTLVNSGSNAQLWFYRDRDAKEIDAVVEQNGILFPIEIKRSANPQRKDVSAFSILGRSTLEVGTGMLICMTQKLGALDSTCLLVPAWAI